MPTGSVTPAVGTAFNGGTITNPLTVLETNGTSKGIVINTQGAGGVNALEIDAPHTTLTVDGDGTVIYASDDFPELRVQGGTTSAALNLYSTHANDETIRLGTAVGIQIGNVFAVDASGAVTCFVPSADPHVSGALYQVAGVVHVSAG